ncbi:polysaccharide deacetylase family sporulation protein PdaB [compost metagenome]
MSDQDEYAQFQSDLAVYHDDYGDYSTNEPTMDGTASLIYLLAAFDSRPTQAENYRGAIIRGDRTHKKMAIVFTGDEYADGGAYIADVLKATHIKASFFFTGHFYNNLAFKPLIKTLIADKHYLGAHSNDHLLYNDWVKRDSLLVNQSQFKKDLLANYGAMKKYGIKKEQALYFLPPYEWYNQTIANWTNEMGLQLINFTPGTRSTADYTFPEMGKSYRNSAEIYQSITDYVKKDPDGLNGFILLLHVGTDPKRTDKFYAHLPKLINFLKNEGYQLLKVDELLSTNAEPIRILK